MTQQHIDYDTLSLFVQTTSHSPPGHRDNHNMDSTLYNDVIDHLAYCEECRNQASTISTLHEKWSDIRQQSQLSDDQRQMICDYLDGSLSADEANEVKTLIETHPDTMKAALHYQSHSTTMLQALTRNGTAREAKSSATHTQDPLLASFLLLIRQFFSIRSPMIYTMTATAALFIAVLLLAQSPVMQQEQVMIAAYQDNPTIQFTDKNKLPGVGFFTQSGSTSKPYDDIMIELVSENTIKITWPEVDGAELYKMRIQVFNQGKKTVLNESSTQTNHTIFQIEVEPKVVNHNKRYEWVLYGITTDDRMFYASGGFVISKTRAENQAEDDRGYDSW